MHMCPVNQANIFPSCISNSLLPPLGSCTFPNTKQFWWDSVHNSPKPGYHGKGKAGQKCHVTPAWLIITAHHPHPGWAGNWDFTAGGSEKEDSCLLITGCEGVPPRTAGIQYIFVEEINLKEEKMKEMKRCRRKSEAERQKAPKTLSGSPDSVTPQVNILSFPPSHGSQRILFFA